MMGEIKMNRYYMIVLAAAAASVSAVQPQNPLSTEAKAAYTAIKNNLTKMADVMSEENYGFKPTPEIRTFGQLVGHIAEAQTRTCSSVMGEAKSASAASLTSKADLVAALKA